MNWFGYISYIFRREGGEDAIGFALVQFMKIIGSTMGRDYVVIVWTQTFMNISVKFILFFSFMQIWLHYPLTVKFFHVIFSVWITFKYVLVLSCWRSVRCHRPTLYANLNIWVIYLIFICIFIRQNWSAFTICDILVNCVYNRHLYSTGPINVDMPLTN